MVPPPPLHPESGRPAPGPRATNSPASPARRRRRGSDRFHACGPVPRRALIAHARAGWCASSKRSTSTPRTPSLSGAAPVRAAPRRARRAAPRAQRRAEPRARCAQARGATRCSARTAGSCSRSGRRSPTPAPSPSTARSSLPAQPRRGAERQTAPTAEPPAHLRAAGRPAGLPRCTRARHAALASAPPHSRLPRRTRVCPAALARAAAAPRRRGSRGGAVAGAGADGGRDAAGAPGRRAARPQLPPAHPVRPRPPSTPSLSLSLSLSLFSLSLISLSPLSLSLSLSLASCCPTTIASDRASSFLRAPRPRRRGRGAGPGAARRCCACTSTPRRRTCHARSASRASPPSSETSTARRRCSRGRGGGGSDGEESEPDSVDEFTALRARVLRLVAAKPRYETGFYDSTGCEPVGNERATFKRRLARQRQDVSAKDMLVSLLPPRGVGQGAACDGRAGRLGRAARADGARARAPAAAPAQHHAALLHLLARGRLPAPAVAGTTLCCCGCCQ